MIKFIDLADLALKTEWQGNALAKYKWIDSLRIILYLQEWIPVIGAGTTHITTRKWSKPQPTYNKNVLVGLEACRDVWKKRATIIRCSQTGLPCKTCTITLNTSSALVLPTTKQRRDEWNNSGHGHARKSKYKSTSSSGLDPRSELSNQHFDQKLHSFQLTLAHLCFQNFALGQGEE